MRQLVQTEESDFARDIDTYALLNTNRGELEAYRARKRQAEKLEELDKSFDKLSRELDEIKNLLIEQFKRK